MSRRTGRSQNGMARGSSSAPPDGVPPWPAGSAGGGAGLARPPDRCLAPAACQPLDGQAGPDPVDPAGPPDRLLTGGGNPGDAALGREPLPATERPAPRDQPEAGRAGPASPLDPFAPAAGRGGRSSGGATRPAPLSASAAFLARAAPAPLTTRREPWLTSASAGGGASGRSRGAPAAALAAAGTVPVVSTVVPTAGTVPAGPAFLRAHRAAR